jgi:hypothetical protein
MWSAVSICNELPTSGDWLWLHEQGLKMQADSLWKRNLFHTGRAYCPNRFLCDIKWGCYRHQCIIILQLQTNIGLPHISGRSTARMPQHQFSRSALDLFNAISVPIYCAVQVSICGIQKLHRTSLTSCLNKLENVHILSYLLCYCI